MIKYSGSVSYTDEFKAHAKASTLFGALQFRYENTEGSGIYLFGKRLSSRKKFENVSSEIEDSGEDDNDKKKKHPGTEGIMKLIKVSFKTVKKILKHILPKELKGDFEFGFDDPYYTGKVLEGFVLLYAQMGEKLKVRPVWDRMCFSGYLELNGRICTVYVLVLVIKLWFNKEFKQIWREYYGK